MTKKELKKEIEEREKSMNEYWDELQKHDPTTYSYPFHQAKKIQELKKDLERMDSLECPYCNEKEKGEEILANGLCHYHNYFYGNK